MKAIGNIHLIWRQGKGSRRISVGIIKKNESNGVRFSYNISGVETAKKLGFQHYEGFPDTSKEYSENVLQIFGQRLIKSERNDSKDFFDFWNVDINKVKHKFYMLGFTQALLPTDNFEFLADYNPVKHLSFITEVTNLTESKISSDLINVGDILTYQLEPEKIYDRNAVKVFRNDFYLGHIKLIHCNVFHKTKKKFKLRYKVLKRMVF